jgi:hypothetical protein
MEMPLVRKSAWTIALPLVLALAACADPSAPLPGEPSFAKGGGGPKNAPVCDTSTGHCYEVQTSPLNWNGAASDANKQRYKGRRGHLVAITSASENAFVQSLIASQTGEEFWTGGSRGVSCDPYATCPWSWVTGEAFSYTAWFDGEPNDPNFENRILINRVLGGWNDQKDYFSLPYIIEYEP